MRRALVGLLILGSIALSFARPAALALEPEDSALQVIDLQGDRVLSMLPGLILNSKELVITGPGPYLLRGELEDLCLHIRSDGETVLILDNVTIRNSLDEALVSEENCSLKLVAEKGTTNTLTAGAEGFLIPDKEASGAALHAKGPLEICGEGSLQINGFINNGIRCNDQLLISEHVNMEIQAANRAIRATDCLIQDGAFRLSSGETCIYADNSLVIRGGSLEADTSDHCIRSKGDIRIEGGTETVRISGGEITMETYGDGIFSEAGILISDGDVSVSSGEDGLQVGGRREYTGRPIRLTGGAVKISAAEDPIDALDGWLVNGGKLLAAGCPDGGKDAAEGLNQKVYAKQVHGRKREEILLRSGKNDLLRLRAAHEYDTVIYSVPGAPGHSAVELLIQ